MLRHILCVENQRRVTVHDGQESPQPPVFVLGILSQPHALNAGSLPFHRLGDSHLKSRTLSAAPHNPLLDIHLKRFRWWSLSYTTISDVSF